MKRRTKAICAVAVGTIMIAGILLALSRWMAERNVAAFVSPIVAEGWHKYRTQLACRLDGQRSLPTWFIFYTDKDEWGEGQFFQVSMAGRIMDIGPSNVIQYIKERSGASNITSEATSEPAPSAASSSPQG